MMALALKRKAGEAIRIGDNIVVTIGETRGRYTTVLVDAPREISVARIEGEKGNASKTRRVRK
jgi:carbon storage regulator CsrA